MSGNFGFDVSNVFGDGSFGSARKGAKKGKKGKGKKQDDFDCLNCNDQGFGGLGIDSFSLAEPNIDSLGIGSDFGSQIGSRAGQANVKGGFLGVIGREQVSVPSVAGRGKIARGRGRSGGALRSGKRKRSPLQKQTGSTFGSVDKDFLGSVDNIVGNVRGAKRRIDKFRAGRKAKRKDERVERPALPAPPPEQLRQPERPALPPPRASSLGAKPRESGSESIARLREEEESRSAT